MFGKVSGLVGPPHLLGPVDYTRFAVRLRSPLHALTGLTDDRLLVRVGHPEPITLIRVLPPSYGIIAEAIELGLLEPLNLQQPLGEVLQILATADGGLPHGLSAPASQPAPPTRRRGLYRLK
jgi:hypothetical protein